MKRSFQKIKDSLNVLSECSQLIKILDVEMVADNEDDSSSESENEGEEMDSKSIKKLVDNLARVLCRSSCPSYPSFSATHVQQQANVVFSGLCGLR